MTNQNECSYAEAYLDRDEYVKRILGSVADKKVVVAGPGTGKTYLFKRILEGKERALTLTFINALVEDLALGLYNLSDVRTLHGFARQELGKANKQSNIKIFPKLPEVIKHDALSLINEDIDFDKLFYNLEDNHNGIEFYKKWKDYYNYYGYTDIVYAAVKYFEKNPNKIPIYEQILIDEFQDFNKLEVALIDLLSTRSPILIAGDDDQALYDFKDASAGYIRERCSQQESEYETFSLPYCSRCTRVVVEATNDVINSSKDLGFLSNRIDKPFKYFACENKDEESEKFPKIVYAQKFEAQIPHFIEQEIKRMADSLKGSFSVLIISPFPAKSQRIIDGLSEKGFQNLDYSVKGEQKVTFWDGIRLLLENRDCNLGWRIVSEFLLSEEEFLIALRKAGACPEKKFSQIIGTQHKQSIKRVLRVIKSIWAGKPIERNEFEEVLKELDLDPYEYIKDFFNKGIKTKSPNIGSPAIRKIPIKATTIQSSKGLAGDLVFITHFDDRYFLEEKEKITDRVICNFIVSLSRTKKKACLISSPNVEPTFLEWISEERIQRI